MRLGLGIDTGGTYTDSVLYNFIDEKVMARAKALTTKNNLVEGILESLGGLPASLLPEIGLVSLSTTLATNACVEGKGSRGKLILLGYDEEILRKLGNRYGLPGIQEILMLPGSHGQQGQVLSEPDWSLLEEKIMACNMEADAFGVAEYWGIRNPAFEQQAKDRIRALTGKPVVGAHELSTEINSLRRASTTLLNARLIPLIHSLLIAVKEGMDKMGIHAPVMVVKGDGTLMSEDFARERPVETLLSGPAASVVGGMKLSGCRDALILDIGGTTSDLAVIRNGYAILAAEGVDVAGWRTGTQAIQISTIGLGGDSQISFDKNEQITIGPRKAAPLSWAAKRWPKVLDRLKGIQAAEKWHTLSLAEFFYKVTEPNEHYVLEDEERRILKVLASGPESVEDLAEKIDSRPYFMNTEGLERQGIIGRAALTPTDLMHISGAYPAWDIEAARLGAEILAHRLDLSLEDLSGRVFQEMERQLYMMISTYLILRNVPRLGKDLSSDAITLLRMGFDHPHTEFRNEIRTPLPIIGIGAPAHIFLDAVAKALGTRVILSEDAGVANAVGAITGSIIGEETVLVKPRYEVSGITSYGCHSTHAYIELEDYDEALEWAKKTAMQEALNQADAMGAIGAEVTLTLNENCVQGREKGEGLLLETLVVARAVGNQAIYALDPIV